MTYFNSNAVLLLYKTSANSCGFIARCNIISRAYATMSVSVCPSVCDGSALWSRCMPGRGERSSRAMLATARPSWFSILLTHLMFMLQYKSRNLVTSGVQHWIVGWAMKLRVFFCCSSWAVCYMSNANMWAEHCVICQWSVHRMCCFPKNKIIRLHCVW